MNSKFQWKSTFRNSIHESEILNQISLLAFSLQIHENPSQYSCWINNGGCEHICIQM